MRGRGEPREQADRLDPEPWVSNSETFAARFLRSEGYTVVLHGAPDILAWKEDKKGRITRLTFVEVKASGCSLTPKQREWRRVLTTRGFRFTEMRVAIGPTPADAFSLEEVIEWTAPIVRRRHTKAVSLSHWEAGALPESKPGAVIGVGQADQPEQREAPP